MKRKVVEVKKEIVESKYISFDSFSEEVTTKVQELIKGGFQIIGFSISHTPDINWLNYSNYKALILYG